MTTVYLAPTFGAGYQAFTTGGLPLNLGLIYTYIAGGTTPQATYTTNLGTVQNANPVVLGVDGRPPSEIWLVSGVSYRFDLKDSLGNLIKTYDNLSGINDPTASSEWVLGPTPTFVGATSFTMSGDQTGTFQNGRRLKSTNTAGTIYSKVVSASYSAGTGLTTVTIVNDSGTLDSGLSAMYYALISPTNPSVSPDDVYRKASAAVASAATTDIWSITGDYVHVTGVTTITSLGTAPYAGDERTLIFDGILTLTHNAASLILPGAANITTAAGDRAVVRADTTANMIVTSYIRASGVQILGTQTANTVLAGPSSGAAAAPTFRSLVPSDMTSNSIVNSISGDVTLNNTGTYFDGPTCAQGTTGTWLATGTVCVLSTAGAVGMDVKLWDGTTVIASAEGVTQGANSSLTISLSGVLANPVANIKISVKDKTDTSGKILFNQSGNSKDSTLTVVKIGA